MLRDRIARYIAIIRGLNKWENLPKYQTKETGCASQEACLREADTILAMFKEEVGKSPLSAKQRLAILKRLE